MFLETRNTYATSDPALPYLLSLLLILSSLLWSLAYAQANPGAVFRIAVIFVFGHFLIPCFVVAILSWLFIGRLFGPGGVLVGTGRRGGRGLFGDRGLGLVGQDRGEGVELGYAFDVSLAWMLCRHMHGDNR